MKEYSVQESQFDAATLKADLLPLDAYSASHGALVISCHDVILFQEGKALLIRRRQHPAKGLLWPIGGRLMRGLSAEDSLRDKVRMEAGFEMGKVGFLGVVRTFFAHEPFGHGKGTDTLNLMFAASASGDLLLDDMHEAPIWVGKEEMNGPLLKHAHPYTQEIMEKAWHWAEQQGIV